MDDGSRLPRRGPAKVIDWIQGLFSGVFHFFKGEQEDSVTEKEIISMVDEAHEKGVLQKDEAEMIQNIFAFEDKEVGAVMTAITISRPITVNTLPFFASFFSFLCFMFANFECPDIFHSLLLFLCHLFFRLLLFRWFCFQVKES